MVLAQIQVSQQLLLQVEEEAGHKVTVIMVDQVEERELQEIVVDQVILHQ
jgi:hypothetical protein